VNPSIRLEAEAASELEASAVWYEENRAGLGERFLDAIDLTRSQIAPWPHSGSPVPGVASDLTVRRVPVGRFPFHVVYLELADEIRVLAFAHDRRLPGYWRSRGAPSTCR